MSLDHVSSGDPHVAAHNAERDVINDLINGLNTKIGKPSGTATGNLLRWDGTNWVATDTRFFEGTTRPDGNFAAPVGSRYINKSGSQGAVEWVKRSGGDSNDGWLCIAGDTGVRNIAGLITAGSGTVHAARISRIGSLVEMYLDLTMPNVSDWTVLPSMPGFSPSATLYGGIVDNRGGADTGGTAVTSGGGIIIYSVVPGKRDRYHGTWLTRDPWPSAVPGSTA